MPTPNVLALILARGGSKGLPRKNVRPLRGKPLVAHSIAQARSARSIGRVMVSTDDPEIAAVASSFGAEVIERPAGISGDTATSESAVLHALDWLLTEEGWEPDLVCLLQCTSPIRTKDDIDKAVNEMVRSGADSLLSVSPSHRFLWQRVESGFGESINYDWRARPRRQDMPTQYVENGSIYLFSPAGFRANGNRLHGRIALHEMSEVAALEIDSLLDFQLVEAALAVEEDER